MSFENFYSTDKWWIEPGGEVISVDGEHADYLPFSGSARDDEQSVNRAIAVGWIRIISGSNFIYFDVNRWDHTIKDKIFDFIKTNPLSSGTAANKSVEVYVGRHLAWSGTVRDVTAGKIYDSVQVKSPLVESIGHVLESVCNLQDLIEATLLENLPLGWSLFAKEENINNTYDVISFSLKGPHPEDRYHVELNADKINSEAVIDFYYFGGRAKSVTGWNTPLKGPGVRVLLAVREKLKALYPNFKVLVNRVSGNHPHRGQVNL